MSKKIKVIEFFGEPLNYGGQEAFIINMYNNFSNKLAITFITPFEATNGYLKNLIKSKNDILINDNRKFDTVFRKINIIKTARKYLNSEYDVIHIHSGSLFTLYNVAKIAKRRGIEKVIVHSHTTGSSAIKGKLIKLVSKNIERYADVFIGCTKEAGISKFPREVVEGNKFVIINNGIDVKKYTFDEKVRNQYRKQFNVDKKTVLINIGRFCYEKNQKFLIELFRVYLNKNENSHLFLVGGYGTELTNIKKLIKKYELENCITILQNRNDINNLLFMSDVFILPSLWEGLPVTGVEAQTTGIPSIFSENITEKINISDAFYKLSLEEDLDKWVALIENLKDKKRYNTIKNIKKSEFDCEISAKQLEKIYLEEL